MKLVHKKINIIVQSSCASAINILLSQKNQGVLDGRDFVLYLEN